MTIEEIIDKQSWKNFVLQQPNTLFVQSPDYGKFYEEMGERAKIFGIFDEQGNLIGGSLVVSTHAKRGNFLYLPYGPVFGTKIFENKGVLGNTCTKFFEFLKNFAKENNYDFIRVSPFMEETEDIKKMCKKHGFRKAPMHMLAETTWILNLKKTEEELLAGMKKNHRNLIRRCQREGIVIKMTRDDDSLKRFNDMHDEVAKRHDFHRFSRKYIRNEFKIFSPLDEAVIFEARLPDGRLDASSIIMFFGNMANYRHSASLNLDKKIPTSYLIQWEVIKEAKRRGLKQYNLWGIAPDGASKEHPFYGITHFKKGFGGEQKDLVHCQDLPISKKYWFNWVVETFRKYNRGF